MREDFGWDLAQLTEAGATALARNPFLEGGPLLRKPVLAQKRINMTELLSHFGIAIPIVAVLVGAAVLFKLFIKNIPQGKIGIVERRWLGKRITTGRVFATGGEIGIEAQYLKPGPHFIAWPMRRLVQVVPFTVIGGDELGYIEATDGNPLPGGRIYAEDAAGEEHNNFQDAVAFLTKGGIRGKQLRVINSGQYMIHPMLFKVEKRPKTKIKEGCIGMVTAADGQALAPGEIVGKSTQGHDSFQQAEVFLKRGGQKGPQIDFLRPGTFNINTDIFNVEEAPAISIADDFVGVVTALTGKPLNRDEVVAETPDPNAHNNYQDGQKFLDLGGKRGPQEAVLPPGTFYINPLVFDVKKVPATKVVQGQVAVLISFSGKDPSDEPAKPSGDKVVGSDAKDDAEKRLDQGVRQMHTVPKGFRGIQDTVLGPGKYYLNPQAFSVVPVPTTTTTLEWSESAESKNFDPFKVVSHDGYSMSVDVQVNYRIAAENAPFVISKVGSIELLEKNVIHPLVDGIFRAQVSESPAISYMQKRAEEQDAALERLQAALAEYKVEAVKVLITNIILPSDLMETVKSKNLAELQKQTYVAQQETENQRIQLEKTRAQANQQGRLMEAQIGIEVAENEAKQVQKRAEGEAARIRTVAEATAEQTEKVGLAGARVVEANGRAQGVAYKEQKEALGATGLTLVEILKQVREGNIKITPDNLVVGGGEGGDAGTLGGLITLLLAGSLKNGTVPATETPATAAPAATDGAAAAAPATETDKK